MSDCIFCRIAAGEIPSAKVYEDENTYAFRDLNPQAPVHVLVIPKKHVSGLNAVSGLTDGQAAACLRACAKVAEAEGIADSGYRVVSNCGPDACQSVQHLHFHVLGGAQLAEKMS